MKKFSEWYTIQILQHPEDDRYLEDIDVRLQLTTLPTLQSLHAQWFFELYNHLKNEGKRVLLNNGMLLRY